MDPYWFSQSSGPLVTERSERQVIDEFIAHFGWI
jgi:hypothetical protein